MSERFTISNGRVKDNQAKDLPQSYNLNNDDGRKDLVAFMNDRETMINELNDEISRLSEIIDDRAEEERNLHYRIRKTERIKNNYKEIVMLLIETIGEIE